MKTAAQLFTSSYLQPNNIDTELSRVARGALRTRKRGKKGEERARKKWKKKFGKIYDFLFALALIISPLASKHRRQQHLQEKFFFGYFLPLSALEFGRFDSNENFHFFLKKSPSKCMQGGETGDALRMWRSDSQLRAL